jgi:membrane-associated phospholipid phosphatase
MPRKAALLAWPDRKRATAFLICGVLLSILWIVVYGGASSLTGLHDYRLPLGFAAEAAIPFVPAASIVYLSLFPLLWLSIFILHTAEEIKQFAKSLAWLFVISGVGFLLLPGEQTTPFPPVDGAMRPVFDFADRINLDYNFCPSLHVSMAVLSASAYTHRSTLLPGVLLWCWATSIAASTLLIHSHYVVDVLAGAALGYVVAKYHFALGPCLPARNASSKSPATAAARASQQ